MSVQEALDHTSLQKPDGRDDSLYVMQGCMTLPAIDLAPVRQDKLTPSGNGMSKGIEARESETLNVRAQGVPWLVAWASPPAGSCTVPVRGSPQGKWTGGVDATQTRRRDGRATVAGTVDFLEALRPTRRSW